MKNIKYLIGSLFIASLAISCDDKDDATGYSTLEVTDGVTASVSLLQDLTSNQTVREADQNSYQYAVILDNPQTVDIHIRVSQIDGNADSDDISFDEELIIPAYSTSVTGNIKIENDDEDEDDETVTLRIGGPTTSNANLTPVTVSFVINDCFSALAGTYSYSTTNCSAPTGETAAGPLTGTVTFTQSAPGEYEISDASFGGWIGLYGPGNVATGVKLSDLCNSIQYTGVDQFNEVFTMSNLVIDGANMSFHWENDYGEFGDTTLTRTDGTNWPALTIQ
jgi:hypothetical protein